MIYAFKTGENFQTLDKHIELCLKTLDKIRNSKLWRRDFNYELVKMMVVYHDIGKVFYQQSNVNKLSFTGHEFISAYIFNKILEYKLISEEVHGLFKEEKLLYLYPIIFHHHSMRVRERVEKLSKVRLIQPNRTQLEELRTMLNNYLDGEYTEYTIEIIKSLRIVRVLSFMNDEERGIFNRIFRKFHGGFARRCLQLLLILIVCDYEGAKSRGKPTSFGKIVEEFLNYYGIPRP